MFSYMNDYTGYHLSEYEYRLIMHAMSMYELSCSDYKFNASTHMVNRILGRVLKGISLYFKDVLFLKHVLKLYRQFLTSWIHVLKTTYDTEKGIERYDLQWTQDDICHLDRMIEKLSSYEKGVYKYHESKSL